ncbi:MAG: hypothetical protein L0G99_01205 [Propionibacteriales bacterium]|nr:hypothetical protein [Propionibacteriales bacterium]
MTTLRAATGTTLRMLLGSTTAAVDDLTAVDDRIGTALPLSRRVGFVSLAGGSGLSSVLVSALLMLDARRSGPILAVDAAGGSCGLGRLLGIGRAEGDSQSGPAEQAKADAQTRRTARTSADALRGLPRLGRNARLVDLADPLLTGVVPSRLSAPVARWTEEVAPIARFSDLVLTDWGVRPPFEDLGHVASTGHVLIVVGRADRKQAIDAVRAVASIGADSASPRMVLVLVDGGRTASRFALDVGNLPVDRLHRIPYDPAFGGAIQHSQRRLSHPTRRALLDLCAALVDEAGRSGAPGHAAAGRVAADTSRPEENWS